MNCQAKTKNGLNCKNKTKNQFCRVHLKTNEHTNSNEHKDSNSYECAICYETINDKPLKCNHYIHLDCIKQGMKPECPLCRTNLSELFTDDELKNMDKRLDDVTDTVNENFLRDELLDPTIRLYLIFDIFTCDKCIDEHIPSMIRLFE